MKFFKGKNQPSKTNCPEEEIQSEIRRRIFAESRKRETKKDARESTQATLDALEKMVHLSREEMEKIAEEVRKEYTATPPPRNNKSAIQGLLPWAAISLIIITFFLLRKGSSWIMISGLLLLFILFNLFRERFTQDDDNDEKNG